MHKVGILTLGANRDLINRYIAPMFTEPSISLVTITFEITKKSKADTIRDRFLSVIETYGLNYVIVHNAKVFKAVTKLPKAEAYLGIPQLVHTLKDVYAVYLPSPTTIYHNKELQLKVIETGIRSIENHTNNSYQSDLDIKEEYYPETLSDIAKALDTLLSLNVPLTCDVEAFSLNHYDSGIGTIAFGVDKHTGVAFAVDYHEYNPDVRSLLKAFFYKFKQDLIFHNITYDVYILIYQLFMEHLEDTEGLLEGLQVFDYTNLEDTMLIAYLSINSTSKPSIGLKTLAHPYTGNYALDHDDIKDIRKIPLPTLLRYNLIDVLATWYVYDTYYPKLVEEKQLSVYRSIFMPATADIIQMQLTGMPVIPENIVKAKAKLEVEVNKAYTVLDASRHIQDFTEVLKLEWVAKRNAKLKVKRVTVDDTDLKFNPNSGNQTQQLLYDFLGLPIINTTASKAPATDNDTLRILLNHTKEPKVLDILNALINIKDANKILNTFIPILEGYVTGKSGQAYLFGSLHLGGTLSGRLSSSNGLQQLPSNSLYGKLIKSCFGSTNDEWIMVGIDYASLEAKIGALLTKDPEKLAIYTDGYDSHSYNTYVYWKDKMPDIKQKMQDVSPSRTYYQITHDDGTIEYVTDLDGRIGDQANVRQN